MKNKKAIIHFVISAVLVIGFFVTIIAVKSHDKHSRIDMHFDYAKEYLDAFDYEGALSEFEKVIEIEPENAEVYISIAKVHESLGDYAGAFDVLERGYGITNSNKIAKKLEKIREVYNSIRLAENETATGNVPLNESDMKVTASGRNDSWEYNVLDNAWIRVTKYLGDAVKVEIPGTIDGKAVISIGERTFNNRKNIVEVIIPDGVISIGYRAFSGCKGITAIKIPDSVRKISPNAFQYCTGMTSIKLSGQMTSIASQLFSGCTGLAEIKIPESVLVIEYEAFSNCKLLMSINIPDGVTTVGNSAFRGCTGLTSVEMADSVVRVGSSAFEDCICLINVKLSAGLRNISDNMFNGCIGMTVIDIPDGVVSIGYEAFASCKAITNISIPESVADISNRAFKNCEKLTLTVATGSFAESYAEKNAIPYVVQ